MHLSSPSISKNIETLLNKMTLKEKVGQLNQLRGNFSTGTEDGREINLESEVRAAHVGSVLNINSLEEKIRIQKIAVEETRLGIPLIYGFDVIHGMQTIFPIPLAQSASWDLEAIEQCERYAAIEASAAGNHWTFAPMLDVSREPRWGRVMEGAGEDTWLGCQIAQARVRGFQGDDLARHDTILACAKHFAAYGAPEGGREYNTVSIGQSDLLQDYLPPFKSAVDAGVATFMCAFNTLNGVPCSSNAYLMQDMLRDKWNFEGFVVSDYNSIAETINHGTASDMADAARQCLPAGCDMDMMGRAYIDHVAELVHDDKLDESIVDQSVRRILLCKHLLGLFDNPYRYFDRERLETTLMKQEHLDYARTFAADTMVLLKNERDLLPLNTNKKDIALMGPQADTQDELSLMGNWMAWGNPEDTVTIATGLKDQLPESTALHTLALSSFEGPISQEDIQKAAELAAKCDTVILAVGEHGKHSGEAQSRTEIGLPDNQLALVKAVHAANPRTICVITCGRPLTIPWIDENIPAILIAWQPGIMGGHAIADILTGRVNPSAKLTMTFPRSVGQVPIYYNQLNTGRPKLSENRSGPISCWRDCPNAPLYPFGYGLSYTSFEYGNMTIDKKAIPAGDTSMITISVKNTGQYPGKEIVQLYIRDMVASIARPLKELKDFKKITLEPEEAKTVTFQLNSEQLKFWNNQSEHIFESGEFEIHIGPNSRDTQCETVVFE
jgi:beta-glucosidase